mgnify:CR=1 FL=1
MASQATIDRLCAEFDSPAEHITAAVKLLEENATPAFLSRYRRYETGNLNEDRLVAVAERLHALTELEQRRATILEQAEERGRRTPELEATLASTVDQDLLDDYYQSMRPRRRGTAMQMEEKGLQPLALAIQHRQFGDAATMTVPKPKPEEKPKKPAKAKAAAEEPAQPNAADAPADAPAEAQAEAQAEAASSSETPSTTGATHSPAADSPAAEAPAADAVHIAKLPLVPPLVRAASMVQQLQTAKACTAKRPNAGNQLVVDRHTRG